MNGDWLAKLGQMFGGGQQPMPMENPYQAQSALANAQMQKQRAMQMQDPQYQGGGAVGVLAGLAQILRGRQLDKRADETITQSLSRMAEFDRDALARRQREEAEARDRQYQDAIKRRTEEAKMLGLTGQAANTYAITGNIPENKGPRIERVGTNLVSIGPDGQPQVIYSAPKEPQAPREVSLDERLLMSLPPAERDAAIRARFKIEPKEKTLTAADIKLIQAEDMRRVSLDNASDVLAKMQQMTDEGVGGPIAALGLNPFTNRLTPQGQAIESYDAAAAELANEITRLTRIPGIGAQSDAELRAALAAIPTSDKSEKTRKEVLAQIAKKIERLKASPTFFELSGGQFQAPNRAQAGDQAGGGQFDGFTITRVD